MQCVVVNGWRLFAPFSRHFAREVFTGCTDVQFVDAPNSIVKQLGGVCKDINKYKALPAKVRGSKGRLHYFFWNESTHSAMCCNNAKRSILAIFQFAKGLGRVDAPIAPLPFLPHEIWEHILSFVEKIDLGYQKYCRHGGAGVRHSWPKHLFSGNHCIFTHDGLGRRSSGAKRCGRGSGTTRRRRRPLS